MKQLLSLVFLLSCLSSFAQEPVYTPMRLNYQFRGIKTDSLFLVPSYTDTTQANGYTVKNIGGALIRTGSDFWMRNGTATAWLQNVNVGPGASPVVQFVDSVWRVAGKDSIFWRKGSVTNKIKDSTVGRVVDTIYRTTGKDSIFFNIAGTTYKIKDSTGKPDRPDRINGLQTLDDVVADANGKRILFTNGENFSIKDFTKISIYSDSIAQLNASNIYAEIQTNKFYIYDKNNTFLSIDTLGNFSAGDLTKDSLVFKLSVADSNFYILSKAPSKWREKNSGLTSQIKTGYSKNDIDLSSAAYVIKLPGVYSVLEASVNTLTLPNPTIWPGQSITIINQDGTDVITYAGGYDPLIYDNTTIGTQWPLSILTMYSDGVNWFAIYNK